MDNRTEILIAFFVFLAAIGVMVVVDGKPPWRFSLRSFLIAMAFAAVVIALVAVYARTVLANI